MIHFINILTWFLLLCIAITSSTITTKHPIHYQSYHFDYNNAQQWTTNRPIHNTDPYTRPNPQIISCTIDIPSLCVYTQTPNAGFLLFYNDIMFDFLNDANWTKITIFTSVTRKPTHNNPTETHAIHSLQRRRLSDADGPRGLSSIIDAASALEGSGRGRSKRRGRSGRRRRRRRRRGRRGRRRRRRRRGRGRSPGRGLFGRRCRKGSLRRMKCRKKPRCARPCFITYLGAPHVLGPPQWIFGGPLQKKRPSGFSVAGAFPMGLGSSPMYPGLMGGYPGVSSPYMWPGTYHGTTGFGGMPGGLTMIGTVPRARRLMVDDRLSGSADGFYGSEVRLKKCVFVGDTEEICAIYWYLDGSLRLEYNVWMKDDAATDYANRLNLEDYMKGSVWIWSMEDGTEKHEMDCNDDLLAVEGYSVCVEVHRGVKEGNEVNIMLKNDLLVHEMQFMSEEGCDEVYRIVNMNGGKKICAKMENVQVCVERIGKSDELIITAQRIWMD